MKDTSRLTLTLRDTGTSPIFLARVTKLLFVFFMLSSSALGVSTASTLTAYAADEAGAISGVVFRDYSADGVRNSNEPGIAGIIVTAYNTAGATSGTATSAADGTYTLAATGTGPYRIEFTSIPAYLKPGPNGVNSHTTVQFVPDGNSSGISLGLLNPVDYSTANTRVLAGIFRGGDQTTSNPVLVSHAYNVNSPAVVNLTTHALANQIGSSYGLAYKRSTKDIFTSAYTKRGVGYGSGGIGAIYKVTSAGAASGY